MCGYYLRAATIWGSSTFWCTLWMHSLSLYCCLQLWQILCTNIICFHISKWSESQSSYADIVYCVSKFFDIIMSFLLYVVVNYKHQPYKVVLYSTGTDCPTHQSSLRGILNVWVHMRKMFNHAHSATLTHVQSIELEALSSSLHNCLAMLRF